MKCSKCHESASNLVLVVVNNVSLSLCDRCFIESQPKTNDIDKLDQKIDECINLIANLEKLVSHFNESSYEQFDESIQQIAFTPSKAIVSAKLVLDDLRSQREEILNKMDDKQTYAYQLKKAVENEEYEIAAEIRDKINSIK